MTDYHTSTFSFSFSYNFFSTIKAYKDFIDHCVSIPTINPELSYDSCKTGGAHFSNNRIISRTFKAFLDSMAPKLTQTIKRVALSPLTAVYALVIAVRHKLFDSGVYKSEAGALPTLVLGNIHAGGTGKTPHASYFLRILSEKLGGPEKVALLSRGYKGRVRGFFGLRLMVIGGNTETSPRF